MVVKHLGLDQYDGNLDSEDDFNENLRDGLTGRYYEREQNSELLDLHELYSEKAEEENELVEEEIRAREEICTRRVERDVYALKNIPEDLRHDGDFLGSLYNNENINNEDLAAVVSEMYYSNEYGDESAIGWEAVKEHAEKLRNEEAGKYVETQEDRAATYGVSHEELNVAKKIVNIMSSMDKYKQERLANIFENVSDDIRHNEGIILMAARVDSSALKYASDDLKCDEEFVSQVVDRQPKALKYADDSLRSNEQFVLPLIKNHRECLCCVSDNLKNDETFVKGVIENDPFALRFASHFRHNKDMVKLAVDRFGDNKWDGETVNPICYASGDLLNDVKFLASLYNDCKHNLSDESFITTINKLHDKCENLPPETRLYNSIFSNRHDLSVGPFSVPAGNQVKRMATILKNAENAKGNEVTEVTKTVGE